MMASGEMMTDDSKTTLSTPTDRESASGRPQDKSEPKPNAVDDARRGSGIDVQAYIGRQLRAVYDDVAKQPVPERFLDLMKQLDDVKPQG